MGDRLIVSAKYYKSMFSFFHKTKINQQYSFLFIALLGVKCYIKSRINNTIESTQVSFQQ